ncbi:hypothetical protein GM676_31100, partial [Duganella radicis]|nr:hypothetical protein [Duganella radicis]
MAGALTIAAGGALYRLAQPPGAQRFALEGGARAVLDAVLPVMLGPALPREPA